MMKISLSFILIILFSISNAQITKGNWMVGGNATFLQQQEKLLGSDIRIMRFSISPNLGYFFVDKLGAGLKPSLDFLKSKTDGNINKSSVFGIGPFLRYYFLHEDNIVNLLAEIDYQYSSGSNGYHQNLFLFSAGPVIYFNSSVGLEFTLNYEIIKRKAAVNSAKTFFLGVGFQIHLEKENNDN